MCVCLYVCMYTTMCVCVYVCVYINYILELKAAANHHRTNTREQGKNKYEKHCMSMCLCVPECVCVCVTQASEEGGEKKTRMHTPERLTKANDCKMKTMKIKIIFSCLSVSLSLCICVCVFVCIPPNQIFREEQRESTPQQKPKEGKWKIKEAKQQQEEEAAAT